MEAHELNPFIYDKPLEPAELVGRSEETELLIGLAESGQNARLSSPRRYGKTSLLRRVQAAAEAIGMPSVYVDFSGVLRLDEVALRIDSAYTPFKTWPRRGWDRVTRFVRPKVTGGTPPLQGELSAEPDSASDVQRLAETLDSPMRIHKKTGKRVLVIFDEFQDVLRVRDALDGLMRSVLQHHRHSASYIFAGSHPGLMNELFASRERPLYGQARAVPLAPLDSQELTNHLKERFESGDRDVTSVIEALVDTSRGHPQRAMMLAHHLWDVTDRGVTLTDVDWELALRQVFLELRDGFRYAWNQFESVEQETLQEVALQQPISDVGQAERLEARADIVNLPGDTGDRYLLVDPLFGKWVLMGDDLVRPIPSEAEVHDQKEEEAREEETPREGTFVPLFPTQVTSTASLDIETSRHVGRPTFGYPQQRTFEIGDRVTLATPYGARRSPRAGQVVAIQEPLAPDLGSVVYFVDLDGGRLALADQSLLMAAAGYEFGERLLRLLRAPVEQWPRTAPVDHDVDQDYANEIFEVAGVVRNLGTRRRTEGLSKSEEELLRRAMRALALEIGRTTGRDPDTVSRRIREAVGTVPRSTSRPTGQAGPTDA